MVRVVKKSVILENVVLEQKKYENIILMNLFWKEVFLEIFENGELRNGDEQKDWSIIVKIGRNQKLKYQKRLQCFSTRYLHLASLFF